MERVPPRTLRDELNLSGSTQGGSAPPRVPRAAHRVAAGARRIPGDRSAPSSSDQPAGPDHRVPWCGGGGIMVGRLVIPRLIRGDAAMIRVRME